MIDKMKKHLSIIFWTITVVIIITALPVIASLAYILINGFTDYSFQKKYMAYKLNRIPNVEVISIRGNEDIELEEIYAEIKVGNNHKVVLNNLSKDVFDYPRNVYIGELNGYIFMSFFSEKIYYPHLNIGTESLVGKELGLFFKSPRNVTNNIDKINDFINNLNKYPEINYFCDTASKTEMYLCVIDKSHDIVSLPLPQRIKIKEGIYKSLKWKY